MAQLKEILRVRGLSTTGAKTELIARLTEADPAGEWMNGQNTDTRRVASNIDDYREDTIHQREIDIFRCEKESRNVNLSWPVARSHYCKSIEV